MKMNGPHHPRTHAGYPHEFRRFNCQGGLKLQMTQCLCEHHSGNPEVIKVTHYPHSAKYIYKQAQLSLSFHINTVEQTNGMG